MFRLEQQGGLARLTLDRPAARNAIPLEGWAELERAIRSIGAEIRLLIIEGAGGAFCAGADLGDFAAMQDDEGLRVRFRTAMRSALDAVRVLEIPTAAWIDGPCYGAGVALAMACDLRVAASSASFAITPAKIGISYPQEDVHRLVELVGTGQASRLLFSALSIDAAEAHRIGLVDLIAGSIDPLAEAVLANDAESLKALKRAIRLAADGRRSDETQDRRFDDLIGGDALAARLEELRRK
jgi:enoyl-CoA hydratase/carnithine racemase